MRWCDKVKIHPSEKHCLSFYEGGTGRLNCEYRGDSSDSGERESSSLSAGKHPSSWSICGQICSACQVVPESQLWPPREATDTRNNEQGNFSRRRRRPGWRCNYASTSIKCFLVLYSEVIKDGSRLGEDKPNPSFIKYEQAVRSYFSNYPKLPWSSWMKQRKLKACAPTGRN